MTARRKSRLPRIGVSHVTGSADYSPTDRDWKKIEKAYDNKLNPPVRSCIIKGVKAYFRDEHFERNASFVRDVEERLEVIGRAARLMNQAMRDDPKSDAGESAFQTKLIIERFLPDPPQVKQDRWSELRQHVAALILAVARAKQEVQKSTGAGLAEGDAWDTLVCTLADIVTEHGLPRGVTKGLDKTVSDTPSPFVRMVESLQSTFPPEARRHCKSYQATAQAISIARQKREDKSEEAPR